MNKEYVVALIPSGEQPPRFVLDDKTGKPPVIERMEHVSAEAMLPYIARLALCGYYLGVNHGRQELSKAFTIEPAWVLETKPVPLDKLREGYAWGDL